MNFSQIESLNVLTSTPSFYKSVMLKTIYKTINDRNDILSRIIIDGDIPNDIADDIFQVGAVRLLNEGSFNNYIYGIKYKDLNELYRGVISIAPIYIISEDGNPIEDQVTFDQLIWDLEGDGATLEAASVSIIALDEKDNDNQYYLQRLSSLAQTSSFHNSSRFESYIHNLQSQIMNNGALAPTQHVITALSFNSEGISSSEDIELSDFISNDIAYISPLSYYFGKISLPDLTWLLWPVTVYRYHELMYKLSRVVWSTIIQLIKKGINYIHNTFIDPDFYEYQEGEKTVLDTTSPLYHCYFYYDLTDTAALESCKIGEFLKYYMPNGIDDAYNFITSIVNAPNKTILRRICIPGIDMFYQFKVISESPNTIEFKIFYRVKPMAINPITQLLAMPLTLEQLQDFMLINNNNSYSGYLVTPSGRTTLDNKVKTFSRACAYAGCSGTYFLCQYLTNHSAHEFNFWSSTLPDDPTAYTFFYRGDINSSSISVPNDILLRLNCGFDGIDAGNFTISSDGRDYEYLFETQALRFPTYNKDGGAIFCMMLITAAISFLYDDLISCEIAAIPSGEIRLFTQSQYISDAQNFLMAAGIIAASTALMVTGVKTSNLLSARSALATENARLIANKYINGEATLAQLEVATKKARFYQAFKPTSSLSFINTSTSSDIDKVIRLIKG